MSPTPKSQATLSLYLVGHEILGNVTENKPNPYILSKSDVSPEMARAPSPRGYPSPKRNFTSTEIYGRNRIYKHEEIQPRSTAIGGERELRRAAQPLYKLGIGRRKGRERMT
jgi:hypothetical protein